jgi:cobalamin biosynthesis protein CbiG
VLGTIVVPHATVVFASGVIIGSAAGLTVIVLLTEASALPQTSVAVQVSVTVPPHAPGVAENVDGFEVPLIRHPPVNPLVKDTVLGTIAVPQETVVFASGVNTGKAAGLTVITRVLGVRTLPQLSIAVQVSVTVPPHVPGVAEKVDALEVPLIRHPPVNPLV